MPYYTKESTSDPYEFQIYRKYKNAGRRGSSTWEERGEDKILKNGRKEE